MSDSLLFPDSRDLLRLDQISVASKARIRGTMQGRRRSRQTGSSLEFADYRAYSPGDDIRQLDWNVYGRTGKAFIKQFLDERELQVNLYIDCSRSMDFGDEGAASKFLHAKRLAACIGYITLAGYDRTGVRFFGDQVNLELPLMRGKGSAHRLFSFLEQAETLPSGDIASALMTPLAVPKQPGMTWVFSDFLYESGVEETLSYLLAARQEVVVIQVLSQSEIAPNLVGDLRLIDSESGLSKEVALSPKILRSYEEAVRQYTQDLATFCRERGMAYVAAVTNMSATDTVSGLFRANGLIQQ
ncbi:MAG: DUF58 domain-containing protein [Gorillibacterium sp.]|nr:DUF58 domain-containing protein [Gorillibacterium sp.]